MSRRNYSKEERRELLGRYRASGQTRKDFAEASGISITSLQRWLGTERQGAGFIEVGAPSRQLTKPVVVAVEFSDGTVLRVSSASR